MAVAMLEVPMPRLSDSMEEGTIVRWIKQSGDAVSRGEELAEIETDKATMVYEAESAGVLEIVAEEGSTLPLGATIARIHSDGTDLENVRAEATPAKEPPGTLVQQPEPPADTPQLARAAQDGEGRPRERRPAASPVARRVAAELGIDLAALEGSGPHGRIIKADVAAAAGRTRPAPPGPAGAAPQVRSQESAARARGDVSVEELTRARQVVVRRMLEAKATAPEFTVTMDIDMSVAVGVREQLREMAGAAPLPTYNDMVVRATALALRDFPHANGSYRDGRLELHSRVNVGVAVASAGGLTVPTIFDTDQKPLGQIAREAGALAAKVREGTITPPELAGGTFTVSNLGMYGVATFTAILNPPQAGILAVGVVEERPVGRDGQLVLRPMMSATLTADHRILYGADAAEFLGRVRDHLQAPRALLL